MNNYVPIINALNKINTSQQFKRDMSCLTKEGDGFKSLLGQFTSTETASTEISPNQIKDIFKEMKGFVQQLNDDKLVSKLGIVKNLDSTDLDNSELLTKVEELIKNADLPQDIQSKLENYIERLDTLFLETGDINKENLSNVVYSDLKYNYSMDNKYNTKVKSEKTSSSIDGETGEALKAVLEDLDEETASLEEVLKLISTLYPISFERKLSRDEGTISLNADALENYAVNFENKLPGDEEPTSVNNLSAMTKGTAPTELKKLLGDIAALNFDAIENYVVNEKNLDNSMSNTVGQALGVEDNTTVKQLMISLIRDLISEQNTENSSGADENVKVTKEIAQEIKLVEESQGPVGKSILLRVIQQLQTNEELSPELEKVFREYEVFAEAGIEETKLSDLSKVKGDLLGDIKKSLVKQIKLIALDGEKSEDKFSNKQNINFQLQVKPEEAKLSTLEKIEGAKTSSEYSTTQKEERFLKGLVGEGSKEKDDKLSLFMNHHRGFSVETNNEINQGKVSVNKATFVSDIIKTVKFMDSNNLKELKVSINPKELGELVVTVTIEAGKMKANISAANKEAYNLIMSNMDEIKNSLGNSEIRIQDFSVNIYQGDTSFFKDGSQRHNGDTQKNNTNGKSGTVTIEDDMTLEETKDSISDNQINILA